MLTCHDTDQYTVGFGTMDREAAFRYLTDYWTLVNRAQQLPILSKERRGAVRAANGQLSVVNPILHEIAPDLPRIIANGPGDHISALPRVKQALDLIGNWRAMEACEQALGIPALPLNMLDPVISAAVAPLWKVGKYRQAVSDAATNLNSFAQEVIGRYDISDKDLMAQAFSDKDPESGKARLRCPGNHETETVRSQQEGARSFASGAFQAIRNPAHHLTGDWNPVTAFHQLTALSQIARWFRYWTVIRIYTPDPVNVALAQAMKTLAEANQISAATATRRSETNRCGD
jgi:uncharacterized protein (TIGR02391 family)